MNPFFGKYRGKVENSIDPMRTGRVQVSVPAVLGGSLTWAMPCVPYAGKDVGFFALPPVNANVWVEFEAGDPDYPIWTGCFWGRDEMPAEAATPGTVLFKTEAITLTMGDAPGTAVFRIETSDGKKLEIGAQGVAIDDGQESSITITEDGVKIEQRQGSAIVLGAPGIRIDNGQGATIDLEGPQVSINKGALAVP